MIHVRCIPDAWENHFPMLRTQYPISMHMGPTVCLSFTTMVHNLKTIKGSLACPCCHRPFFYPCISQAMSRLNSWLEISFALLIHILFQCTCANAISSAGTPVKRQEEQAAILNPNVVFNLFPSKLDLTERKCALILVMPLWFPTYVFGSYRCWNLQIRHPLT